MWQHRGQARPAFAAVPRPGQESVWDYPRPPGIAPDPREVVVRVGGREIARTLRAVRVLETASPPTFYVPPADVDLDLLEDQGGGSFCEWKGSARYFAVVTPDARIDAAAWSYPQPSEAFRAVAGWLSFYPGKVECSVAGERVRPQPGGFYGGWITSELVGPFKGEPGTGGW